MQSKNDIIAELRELVEKLSARVAYLELELAKARKDSSNSSKSPSSDITGAGKKKMKKPGGPRKRKAGGQPGRDRKLREALPSERVDEIIEYEIDESEVTRLNLTATDQLGSDETSFKNNGKKNWVRGSRW